MTLPKHCFHESSLESELNKERAKGIAKTYKGPLEEYKTSLPLCREASLPNLISRGIFPLFGFVFQT